jgi:hypothetical protein
MPETKDKKPMSAEDQAKNDEKELKRLLESYLAVAKHKLGRPATMEDLTKMLSPENQGQEDLGQHQTATPVTAKPVGERSLDRATETQPAQGTVAPHTDQSEPLHKDEEDSLPAIVRMKIYYGMAGDGEHKKPDPSKILYYETHDGRFYNTHTQDWEMSKPVMADHLPSRPIEQHEKDVVAAIAHGVMDEDSFNALDKAEMIGDTPRRLWQAMTKLKSLHQDLEKSTEPEDIDSDPSVDPDLTPGGASEGSGGVDVVGSYMDTAGVARSQASEVQDGGEPGEDLIRQIMEAAVEAVSDDIEIRVLEIVRRELAKYGLSAPEEEPLPNGTEPDSVEST